MDFQQQHHHHHGYMRPQAQPPSVADPQQQQQLPPRLPPPPPPPSWFSGGQFQYQHPSSHQSPSHPHAQQWLPPPPLHSDHHHSYPTPPYPTPNPYQNHFPPHLPLPGSHMPPHYPHSYSQDWNNSWGNNQAPNNEEDWASKARAWAASKAETDNQQHFAPVGKPEDQGHFPDQYSQTSGPHYSDGHLSSATVSGYQQYPAVSFPQRPVSLHPQESLPIAHIQHVDHFSFNKDAKFGGDSRSAFHHHQESLPATASLSQQEVSSSYSSVAGKDGDHFPHHANTTFPAVGAQSVPMDQSYYPFGLQPVNHATDLSDQPLDFTHKFDHALDHKQPSYRKCDTGSASIHTWPATVYPPVPPVLSGQQHDPSLALVSPLPGPTPLFGTISGPSFQSPIQPVGVPFSIATASGLDPITVFPMDAYGVSSMVERPKKASVPNWLRDEIIKNKATIASSAPELSKEEAEYPEDETADKPLARAGQIDNINIDSSRSEEEDDDEDELETTRSAAINHQIKRILTEVLLKVTDKLFDEIAMEVLNEDVLSVDVKHGDASKKVPLSATAVPSPKASTSVLITAKVKEVTEDDSNKSGSSSPADILGLGTYASDEDVEEIHTSAKQNSKDINVQQQHAEHLSEDKLIFGNAVSLDQTKQNRNLHGDVERSNSNASGAFGRELVDNKTGKESSEINAGSRHSTKYNSQVLDYQDHLDDQKMLDGADAGNRVASVDIDKHTEHTVGDVEAKKLAIGEYEGKGSKGKEQKNGTSETRRNASAKVSIKEPDCIQNDELDKGVKSDGKRDENQAKKIRTECRNGSNEKIKEQGGKSGEKRKESDSRRKTSHSDVKESRKEKDRSRIKESDRREHKKGDRRERQRHHARESNRNKRRRSSSVSSRGRTAKEDSVVSHVHESSNESSEGTDRKLHSRKDRSPSPIRIKRRQDSRSPHSKHSQRRHSPYSSLASTRVRRSRSSSRSRSPVGRKK
ncbi:arginine/serine-rich protein PNISR isoform X2 [Impatiens glandulifera]|uniref:arginine/serine-rich protein PNISR isoform X2 n=1 Tax=Impatiens glandulifera TaxID=253017 RepID=UPI001FB0932C|nr:arginine/serine-rich protein PNISR isoform X2 [Impatiens glandulifera]